MNYDYDLFVIGAGSAGVRASRWAASLGAKVAIAEKYRYGGTCVIRGCVPKKMMVNASSFTHEVHVMKQHGWSVDGISHDWNQFRLAREKEIERLSSLYQKTLNNNKVEMFHGSASFVDQHTIAIKNTENGEVKNITAKNILIAPGGKPQKLNVPGKEFTIDSNDFFKLEERPQKTLVLGAGFIGVEFAGVLNGFGSDVTIALRKEFILTGFDHSSREFLQNEMIKTGIKFKTKVNVEKIEKDSQSKLIVTFDNGEQWSGDSVIMATGRVPDVSDLALENCQVKTNDYGAIIVDDAGKTNIDHIYAAGDVIDKVNLTPVALHQGMVITENIFADANKKRTFDLENIPQAVFSQPPYSGVGLTEEKANELGHKVKIYTSSFRPLQNTLGSMDEQKTYCKLIIDEDSQKVLGVHMVGSYAAEIIQGFAVAVKMGATKADFDQTIGIHPSSAEEFVTMR
ncbi:MAG: glutathione-disulfide reductase [Oligoflexia bacterium]|nr:glutathione-disulfide reductase [Oligoflexia bacterium]